MTTLRHAALDNVSVSRGELLISGQPLSALIDLAGGTPCYFYDRDAILERVRMLKEGLAGQVALHYAVKANPMPEVVDLLATAVDGMDVASVGEMNNALRAGIPPERISMAGPGKRTAELQAAIQAGVILNAESERELDRIAALGQASGVCPRVAIRVNPAFELKTSGMKMGGGAKPFGIDAEQVPALLRRWDPRVMTLAGLHIFWGSQNLHAEAIISAQNQSVALARELAQDAPCPFDHINIGGGFGIPYFPGETALDVAPVLVNLCQLATALAQDHPASRLVIELGRYLVGEAGYYVCEVIDKKVSRGETFLVTDGGIHHHLAASGNFGQVLRKNYPVLIGNRMDEPGVETVTIVGPCCTPLDIIASRVQLPAARPGDRVVVLQSGAYGLSVSPLRFLSHPEPRERLL